MNKKDHKDKKQGRSSSPYIYVSDTCNNDCIFCSEANSQSKKRSKEEIKKEINKIRKKWEVINFMGKEPTQRDDIIELLKFAVSKKFKQVGITTNGRRLSYNKFAKKVLSTGVNQIVFSICSNEPKLHDIQTKVKGSFEQTLNGIRNVLKLMEGKKFSVIIDVLINKLNYKKVGQIIDFLVIEGIKEINILNVLPLSERSRKKEIIPKITEVLPYLIPALDKCRNKRGIRTLLVGFPPCLLPKRYAEICFPCLENNPNQKKLLACKGCKFKNCAGVLEWYLKLYGDEEFLGASQ